MIRMTDAEFVRYAGSAFIAASDDMARLHMNAVFFRHKCNALDVAATDGHMLVSWKVDGHGKGSAPGVGDQPDAEHLVPKEVVAKAIALAKKLSFTTVEVHEDKVIVGGDSLSYRLTGVQFPPFEQAIPATGAALKATLFGVNAHLLGRACKVFELAWSEKVKPSDRSNRGPRFAIEVTGDKDPIVLSSSVVPELVVVVMPFNGVDPGPRRVVK